MKPRAAARTDATTWVIGNSRPELGINPESASWPTGQSKVFNYSIPGSPLVEQGRNAATALGKTGTTHIYWALDFVDFTGPRGSHKHCNRTDATAVSEDLKQPAKDEGCSSESITNIQGLQLERVAELRVRAKGSHWIGLYELEAHGFRE